MNFRIFSYLRIPLLGLCVLSAGSQWGYSQDDIQTWYLEDGTEVMLLEDFRAPLVSIELNFPVNRLMPWSMKNGGDVAFACQTMAPDRRIRKKAERLGAYLSASMGWGRARIGGSSLATDFPELVELIRESLTNREFDKKEVRMWQRDRILTWKSGTTNPRTELSKHAMSLVYPLTGDPRNSLYDKPKSIRVNDQRLAAVRDTVIAAPGRNIAVSGAVRKEELELLIKDLLPPIDDPDLFHDTLNEPASFSSGTEEIVELKKLTQVYLALVRDSMPFKHEDYPAYLVANQILGGTFSSRLYQKLRHESGDTYSATLSSWYTTASRPGMLILQTYTRAENAQAAERKLKDVLMEVYVDGVTDSEVQQALAYLKGRLVFARETPSQVVNQAAVNKVAGLPPNFREVTLERAAAMGLDEINSFIRSFYDPTKFALVKVIPKRS